MSNVLRLQTEVVEFIDDTRGSALSLWSCDPYGSWASIFAC